MLKFVKNYMDSIPGIEIYPLISLLIFFTFFAGLFWWVITAKKEYINKVSNLPLDNQKGYRAMKATYKNMNPYTVITEGYSCPYKNIKKDIK